MCFCGATDCWYCGQLQGEIQCTCCGATASIGCERPEECSTLLLMQEIREEYEEVCGYAVEPEDF